MNILQLFYFEHINVEMNVECISKRPQPFICYWQDQEVIFDWKF